MTKSRRLKPKSSTYRIGLRAEAVACWWLRLKGYRILAQRYRSPYGEADIIAQKKNSLVVVEVKARTHIVEAAAAIQPRQQARFHKAAQAFLAEHPHFCNHMIRFDAMLFSPNAWPVHLRNAWAQEGS